MVRRVGGERGKEGWSYEREDIRKGGLKKKSS